MHGLLAVLILAAMHGETSLRGMWLWGKARADRLKQCPWLGLWGNDRFPALSTFWQVVQELDADALEAALRQWDGMAQESALSLDGKHLRGSRREGEAALRVMAVAGQRVRQIVSQCAVEDNDETEAALKVIAGIPLEGKVVSADAGLLRRPLVQAVVQKGGHTSD